MNKIVENYYGIRFEHDQALNYLNAEVTRIFKVMKSIFKLFGCWHYDVHKATLPRLIDCHDWFYWHLDDSADLGVRYNEGFPIKFFDMSEDEIKQYLIKKKLQKDSLYIKP